MERKRMASRHREGVSKRKKGIREDQEESKTVEKETWQQMSSDYSEKKEELDGAGLSDATLDKLSVDMNAMKKELEGKINAGFKVLRHEIDAGFKALKEEIAARKEQQKCSIPKSSKAAAHFASIPVQVHSSEIEAILKEVTKSTSSEENYSETKTRSSSEEFWSSSSEKNKKEAGTSEEVTIVAPRSFPATKEKKSPAPTRRSSRIAGK